MVVCGRGDVTSPVSDSDVYCSASSEDEVKASGAKLVDGDWSLV